MRITQEADYAIRIINMLADSDEKCCAKTLSDHTGVSLRFALKILRKLCLAGFVCSCKGVQGGYELKCKPEEISLLDVIEVIDGQIVISRCQIEHKCSMVDDPEKCAFYSVFSELSEAVTNKFASVTFAKNKLPLEKASVPAAEGRQK